MGKVTPTTLMDDMQMYVKPDLDPNLKIKGEGLTALVDKVLLRNPDKHCKVINTDSARDFCTIRFMDNDDAGANGKVYHRTFFYVFEEDYAITEAALFQELYPVEQEEEVAPPECGAGENTPDEYREASASRTEITEITE